MYTHCHSCGTEYNSPDTDHPECASCGTILYRNPAPVAVCLTPVIDRDRVGLLLVNRQIAEHGWALPGGFVENGENIGAAALRELNEETGIKIIQENLPIGHRTVSVPDGSNILIFCQTNPIEVADLESFRENEETTAVGVAFNIEELERFNLVFGLHEDAAREFFERLAAEKEDIEFFRSGPKAATGVQDGSPRWDLEHNSDWDSDFLKDQ